MFTATVTISSARLASTRKRVSGIAATMSVGLWMSWPSILNWAPARTTANRPNSRMFTGSPQKLPTLMVRRSGQPRAKSQKFRIMVPYRVTQNAAPPKIFNHICEPLMGSPLDQAMEAPARRYIQAARAATVSRITGPAKDS